MNGGSGFVGRYALRVVHSVLLFKESGFMVLNGTLTYLQLQQPGCTRTPRRPASERSAEDGYGGGGEAIVWRCRVEAPRTRERAFIGALSLIQLLGPWHRMVRASFRLHPSNGTGQQFTTPVSPKVPARVWGEALASDGVTWAPAAAVISSQLQARCTQSAAAELMAQH